MQKPVESEHITAPETDPEQTAIDSVESPPEETKSHDRDTAQFGPPVNERRQAMVFSVEDFSFRSSTPSPTHWSIGWSDLMMTMFILFLTLFVYQATHKQILVSKQPEVVGGETTQSVEIAPENSPSSRFAPIKPSLPLITGGTIKKVIPVPMEEIDSDTKSFLGKEKRQTAKIPKSIRPSVQPERTGLPSKTKEDSVNADLVFSGQQPTTKQPGVVPGQKAAVNANQIHRLFGRIRSTISKYNLTQYASVDLLSNTMIRVVLTSDLFFSKATAEITPKSAVILQKIGAAIKIAPFMIDVVGHTDDHPLHSDHFPSNWEFSVARASSVARFFINETEMNPNQFVVSGFSSYRPLYPNTSAQNRAANRRVDIIISNRYPDSTMAN